MRVELASAGIGLPCERSCSASSRRRRGGGAAVQLRAQRLSVQMATLAAGWSVSSTRYLALATGRLRGVSSEKRASEIVMRCYS